MSLTGLAGSGIPGPVRVDSSGITGYPARNYGTDAMPPAGPQAQGWTGKCQSVRCQCLAEVGGSSSRHRPGQVLADLAPRAKVVQTVGCSTFTRGAKPATRRVADGERMNPPGKGGAYAPIRETSSTRATTTWRTVHAGAPPPCPRAYDLVGPAVSPPDVLRGRGRIFPAPARGNPAPPSWVVRGVPVACDRAVIRGI